MQYQVVTGPLYEKAAKRMMKYRQIAARIPNAKPNTAAKLDRTLERLSESISEILGELTDKERMALIGWQDGIMRDVYELNHYELMERPYASICRTYKWTEEVDRYPIKTTNEEDTDSEEDTDEVKAKRSAQLQQFLKLPEVWD